MNKYVPYRMSGLDYVYLVNPPIKKTPEGDEYIDIVPAKLELEVLKAIIKARVPIRGAEVVFLRNVLKMNRNDWAKKLGMTAAGILRWERARETRLSLPNEVAVRLLCMDAISMKGSASWSDLVSKKDTPKKMLVAA